MTAPVPGSMLGAPIEEDAQIPVKMSRRQWTVVLLLVVSVIINYIDRSNLSIAAPVIQHEFALSSAADRFAALRILLVIRAVANNWHRRLAHRSLPPLAG